MTTDPALLITPCAWRISPSDGCGGGAGNWIERCKDCELQSARIIDNGISICTGPGLAVENSANAEWMAGAISSTRPTVNDLIATERANADWSGISCKLPRLERSGLLTPLITSIGIESALACNMAVAIFASPGPVITRQTPGFPLIRAYPSAIKPAPCSCRGVTCLMRDSASPRYNSTVCMPGMPNTTSTS